MVKRNLIHSAVRYSLMVGAAVTAASFAATASAANSNTPANLGKVTVTGTRIKRTNIETAQPITRISRQQIERSGYTTISQLLGRLSFAGAHARSISKNHGGTTTVSLRGLGADRNLVLVNGKRWLQGLGGTTNLNTIPTSIVDHIEILQDGASAVYGSDAITGVINVITVKNFNGAEAHAYYGIHNDHRTGSWDGQVRQYDFTIGGGNDRGNVVFNVTYRKQNGTFGRGREITRTPVAGEPPYVEGHTGTPRGHLLLFGPAVSDRTFGQGTCSTYNPSRPADPLCALTLQQAPAPPSTENFRNFKNTDLYYLERENPLIHQLKDVTAYVQGHYDLLDNVTFTANAAYIRDEPYDIRAKEEFHVGSEPSKTANGHHIGIAASNPYNPFGVDLVADSTDPCLAAGTCIGLGALDRHVLEGPPRTDTYDDDNFHIFAGFNGFVNLFNREIDWDVGFAQNRSQRTDIGGGYYNTAHVARALGPVSQCTSPCVPLNAFGGSVVGDGGSITPAQLNYILFEPHDIQQSNLRDWTANLSSDVYNLPAGPLGVAIGYERVDNYGYNHPDAVKVQGNYEDGSNPQPLRDGRIVRDAEYAELNIPLLADLPGAKSLSVDVANRWTQFERSGGVRGQRATSFFHNSSGRLNIRYQPFSDLLLRASWSQGFRSPNIPTLFAGQTALYPVITDPCASTPNGGYTGGALPPNCPNGTLDIQPGAHIDATGGGNPNLEPEKSVSRTVGFVYSPSQVPGLDVNADYFKIELNNAIGTVGIQNIINGCFYNSSFCNLLTVTGNRIADVRNTSTNVGSLLTEGIDIGLHYKFPSTPIGDFDARINGTFLKTYDVSNVNRATKTGFATSHLAGVSEHPKRRFNGYLDWDYGNWSAQYRIEYYGAVVDRCSVSVKGYCTYPNRATNFQGTPGRFSLGRQHLGATVYHDVHVAYTMPSINTSVGLGVHNLFDKKPPITGSGGFDGNVYRLPSRFVYGSVRVRF
jgi:outer membrane receptor protein involved in Fe transport